MYLMKLYERTGVLIGVFFLFCSQDEVSSNPRRLRAVFELDETNDEMASENVSFSERNHYYAYCVSLLCALDRWHVYINSISQ